MADETENKPPMTADQLRKLDPGYWTDERIKKQMKMWTYRRPEDLDTDYKVTRLGASREHRLGELGAEKARMSEEEYQERAREINEEYAGRIKRIKGKE